MLAQAFTLMVRELLPFTMGKENDMFTRSHVLSLTTAMVLAGSTWAQQPPQGQSGSTTGSPTGASTGSPESNSPTSTSAIPQDQQMDIYSTDKSFVKNAAEVSAIQVHLGKLAEDKASTSSVKDLGKQMVEAHTQTGQQLKQAAAALNVDVPADPPRKAKKAEEKLAKLSGNDFDRAYAKMAADEQKQGAKEFEREAKNGKVPGVKDFAAKRLPAEQERQKNAEQLASAEPGTEQQK
jgi:putative membrane protein